jgi:hypothetical protein
MRDGLIHDDFDIDQAIVCDVTFARVQPLHEQWMAAIAGRLPFENRFDRFSDPRGRLSRG